MRKTIIGWFAACILATSPAVSQTITVSPPLGLPSASGDITCTAPGVCAIGATKVTSAMLNSDVFSTAHSWAGQQTFVAPILGTPASGVATNLTGTAASLTAGTVTTNANLTGPITSSGNATSIASQTGTGTQFVMSGGNPVLSAQITVGGPGGSISAPTTANTNILLYNLSSTNWAGLGVNGSGSVYIKTGISGTPVAGFVVDTVGGIQVPLIASSSAAQTGTVCWTTSTGNLTVDTTTTCLLSSAKFKHDIAPLEGSLATTLALRPVSYVYNAEQFIPGQQVGFVAEDVALIDKRLVSLNEDGTPKSVRYQQLTAVLAGAIQELEKRIEALEGRH